LLDKKLTRMRPGTLGICASIKHKYNVDTVPHVLCGGFTQEETEYLLVDCHYLGIENVMALRGDAMKDEQYFIPKEGGNNYAVDLVKQIDQLNKGKYLHEVMDIDNKSDFCIGVAGYPEKHLESPSLTSDLKRLKEKVDAGAHYVVTQMFFDNSKFFEFVTKAREMGITVPIIPGLKILTSKNHVNSLPKNFFIDIPKELAENILNSKPEHTIDIGVEWTLKQVEDLLNHNVPAIHFYIMQSALPINKLMAKLKF